MDHTGQRFRTRSPWKVLLALVCLVLVVVAGTVQVAHTHTDGAITHPGCSLCAAAHMSVQAGQTPASVQTVAVVTSLEAIPPPGVPVAISTFALFTRPPPVDFVPS
jgi:hypothetical protein